MCKIPYGDMIKLEKTLLHLCEHLSFAVYQCPQIILELEVVPFIKLRFNDDLEKFLIIKKLSTDCMFNHSNCA